MKSQREQHSTILDSLGRETLLRIAQDKSDLLVAAIESCPINITIADINRSDMPIIYANPAFTETTGYTFSEAIGHNCRFLQGPETDPNAVTALRQAIKQETDIEVEFINYNKDGTPFINALKIAPVHNAQGKLISYIGIQNDVTQERRSEQKEVERQRIEALGQMAGGVTHQLNNLLQPIITLTSLHKDNIQNEHISSDMETVLQSARQAAELARNILSFSRRQEDSLEVLSITELIRHEVKFIRTMLPVSTLVDLNIAQSVEPLKVNVNATQFSQALANLMINASQAMQSKGKVKIDVSSSQNKKILISVKDTGPGIPKDIRSQVLEPFFTTKAAEGGTGLGLSVVYGIIKRFGGNVLITEASENSFKGGCCITITLPTKP
ncbi:MAG: ATP-binding protein [Pseudomonadota bacterium]